MITTRAHIALFLLFLFWAVGSSISSAQQVEPTDEEQLMLELINRARSDPPAEGTRLANHPDPEIQGAYSFFNHDVEAMEADFQTYPPRPPLAMNLKLIQAARRHSADMRDNRFQDHFGTDGSDPGQRLTEAGYEWRGYGENVFAHGENVEHAHAAFVADWNVPSLGHRKNTLEFDHDPNWKEVGIGILRTASAKVLRSRIQLKKTNEFKSAGMQLKQQDSVGPLLVTIDFSVTFSYTPQLLGVVYADTNNNDFYDLGEGLGGVQITVVGTNFSTITFSSGGYSIPISTPGEYDLEASGGLLPEPMTKTFNIGSEDNVKVDFVLKGGTAVPDWKRY